MIFTTNKIIRFKNHHSVVVVDCYRGLVKSKRPAAEHQQLQAGQEDYEAKLQGTVTIENAIRGISPYCKSSGLHIIFK